MKNIKSKTISGNNSSENSPVLAVIRENSIIIISLLILVFVFFFVVSLINSKIIKKKFRNIAYVDSVTGLLTIEKFRTQASLLLKNANPKEYMIFSTDINNFKYVNDAFGYQKGNLVLQAISNHFKEHDDLYILASRMHADNFIFLSKALPTELLSQNVGMLHNVSSHLRAILPKDYQIAFSTGIYLIDNPYLSLDAMMDKAATARKSVKGSYKNSFYLYTAEIDRELERQKDVILGMERALNNHEFLLYLQPKIDLQTQAVIGAEALVRWQNPDKGFMMPADFISLFEENGFIIKLDMYMFEQVCLLMRGWLERFEKLNSENALQFVSTISVNLSKYSLSNPYIVEDICKILETYKIPPHLIEIELTESLVTDDIEKLLSIMDKFNKRGLAVSIDDFGSGYSSLNLLKDLPVQIIKIDRGFLSQSSDTYKGQVIISSVLHMAKQLGICTVAEGVETEDQARLLLSMGCNMAQGYYYSKPILAEDYAIKYIYKNAG